MLSIQDMIHDQPSLNVDQLINELKKFPLDAKVIIQGCDCYGDVEGVEEGANNTVIITRLEE